MTPPPSTAPDAGVRAAREADCDALGAIHARAWQASYGELLPDTAAPALAPASLAQSWRAAVVEPPTADHRVLVATSGPDVVGFVAVAPTTDADTDPATEAELLVLLIDPEHQHEGHASRLLNACADTARERGTAVLRAWVPDADTDRQGFLQQAGFAPDGATRVLDASGDGASTVREVRLSARLDPLP
ncbi:MAG TPA: GNAT family N-acetyltransferase [Angustibacter sp.]|nr:GNAT family N-acetyltransferase [Angustibacter sp.]